MKGVDALLLQMHCLLVLHGLLQITQCSDARAINCIAIRVTMRLFMFCRITE